MAARKEGWRLAGSSVFAWCFFFNEFGYLIKFICPIRTRDRWDPRIPPAWTRPQSCITSGFCLRESPHTRRHRKYNRVWWGLQQSCCQNPQFTVLGFFFFCTGTVNFVGGKKCERDQHQNSGTSRSKQQPQPQRPGTGTELRVASSLLKAHLTINK